MAREKHVISNICWRMSLEDKEIVKRLADLWGCNQSEALRTACRLTEVQVFERRRG